MPWLWTTFPTGWNGFASRWKRRRCPSRWWAARRSPFGWPAATRPRSAPQKMSISSSAARTFPGRAAALSAGMDYFEVLGVGMFLDREDPNPRHAVHLVWAGERVRPEYELPSPTVAEHEELSPGLPVVSLAGLVCMKLLANRDQDRVHLRDMIDVGLVGREMLDGLSPELAKRLELLLAETGR